MKKVILDCDNTMGVEKCDVDDAHALLYLLGNKDIEVLGVTTTYGNSDINIVYDATQKLFEDLNINIPLLKGEKKQEKENKAAEYLVKMANEIENLTILATGSTTNLYHAYLIDKDFLKKVKIISMGGITEPLVFEKRVMDELNLSIDHIATKNIIENADFTTITGNNCLKTTFTKEEFEQNMHTKKGLYIKEKSMYYFDYNYNTYGIIGFHNWDVVAACYFAKPELFRDNFVKVKTDEKNLQKGYLEKSEDGYIINMPEIIDIVEFKKEIYEKLNAE